MASAADERCIFPYSNTSIFSPTQDFPWHQERFGSRKLPHKKWTIVLDNGCIYADNGQVQISFKEMVKKILVGRSIKSGITGTLKGKVLTRADLPLDLEKEVARQLECAVPAKRGAPFKKRNGLSRGPKKTSIITSVIKESAECSSHHENELSDEDEVFDSSEESIDLDDLEDAFEHFLFKLDNLDTDDLDEITSGVKSGLKSWLAFGTTMAANNSSPAAANATAVQTSEEYEPQASSRLRVLFRNSTSDNHIEKQQQEIDEIVGPSKSGRAAAALASIAKGDDKLTRKSEEQVSKITGDFCNWLRELPLGEDQTVNNTSPDKIRSLFDSTHNSRPTKSKVVEGLRSWAKFGSEFAGTGGNDLASIARQEISKNKVKTKFAEAVKIKKRNRRKANGSHSINQGEDASLVKLDHRQYGVWYLKPSRWEQRFHQVSDSKEIAKLKARRRGISSDTISKHETITEEVAEAAALQAHRAAKNEPASVEEDSQDQLHSIRAFSEFLEARPNYEPPPFLKKALLL